MLDFDLDAMETKSRSEGGVPMPVRSLATGEPLLTRDGKLITITVLGPDSEKYRAKTREQVRKRFQRQAAGDKEISDAEAEREALEVLVFCTVGWAGVNDKNGEAIPFNADAVRALYAGFPAIRDQVDNFMASRANFIKASS